MNHTILGKGAWGEAMGLALQERGHDVKWLDKGEHKIPSSTNILWIALPTQAVRECFETVQSDCVRSIAGCGCTVSLFGVLDQPPADSFKVCGDRVDGAGLDSASR